MIDRFVIMGVSGCGKSHIGHGFAKAIDAAFIDGDVLHPKANIDKMAGGQPLDDNDRAPWLEKVGVALQPNTVISCSALKRRYRDQIRAHAAAPVLICFLKGDRDVLQERVKNRAGHFMPPALLDSQLATLEPPTADELHVMADITHSPEQIIAQLIVAAQDIRT